MTTSPTSPIQDFEQAYSAILVAATDCASHEERLRAIEAVGYLRDASNRRTKIINLVQEALSQLRLDLKYLAFDLDATRRERDTYKARLGE